MTINPITGFLSDKPRLSEFFNEHIGTYKIKSTAEEILKAFANGELVVLKTSDPMHTKGGRVRTAEKKEAVAFYDMFILDEKALIAWLDKRPDLRSETRRRRQSSLIPASAEAVGITSEDQIYKLVEAQRQAESERLALSRAREEATGQIKSTDRAEA